MLLDLSLVDNLKGLTAKSFTFLQSGEKNPEHKIQNKKKAKTKQKKTKKKAKKKKKKKPKEILYKE